MLEGARAGSTASCAPRDEEVASARAVAEIPQVTARLEELNRLVVDGSAVVETRTQVLASAERVNLDARVALEHHETLATAARADIDRARAAVTEATKRVGELEGERSRLAVEYWRRGWADSTEAAAEALVDEQRGEPRLRKEASEALRNALWELGMRDEESAAPTPELATVVRRRRGIDDDGEAGVERGSLDDVGAPLADYLDAWVDQDRLTESTINVDRDRRERELEAARGAA